MQIDSRLADIHSCLYRVAIKAFIVQNGKVLIVKESEANWWSLPGGGVDYGEDAKEALRRELSEELGVEPEEINIGSEIVYSVFGQVIHGVPRANLYYRAKIPADKVQATAHVEDFLWINPDDISSIRFSPTNGDITKLKEVLLSLA